MKVVNKGFTLKVTSWENDGDQYKTKYYTVPTSEEAEALYTMCTVLFKSCNNGKGGIGNSTSSYGLEEIIIAFFNKYRDLFSGIIDSEEDFYDYCDEISYELMGSSDHYYYRVCESCVVFYSPEDIHCEEVKFN